MQTFERGSTAKHQDLTNRFMVAVSKEFDDVMILPYTVGMFRDFDTAERIIHAGQKGVTDLVVLGCGWYLWFDTKTGKARFSTEQTAFAERLKEINKGTSHVYKLTSVEQGIDVIRTAKEFYARKF